MVLRLMAAAPLPGKVPKIRNGNYQAPSRPSLEVGVGLREEQRVCEQVCQVTLLTCRKSENPAPEASGPDDRDPP